MAARRKVKRVAAGVYRRALSPQLRRRLWRLRQSGRDRLTRRIEPLLTVVMPVYNVERYLEEAVESVLSQSYRNLELILVDDGATDSSGTMCDELATADKRIRVIHQPNAGLGAARNTGIAAARGDYLAFADSDDYLLPDAYERMMRSIIRSGSDIVTGNVLRRQGRYLEQSWIQKRSHIEDRTRVSLVDEVELLSDTVAWNKIYRTRFWKKHGKSFPVGKLYEDTATIFHALLHAQGIDIVSAPVYVWRLRDEGDSITQRLLEATNVDDRFEMLDHVETMIRDSGLWRELGNRLLLKVLEVDLWVHVRGLIDTGPAEAIERIQKIAARYWEASPDQVKLGVPAERRVCYWLLANERAEDMLSFRWWYASQAAHPPLVRRNGQVSLDVVTSPVSLDGVPDVALDMDDLAEPIVNVVEVNWTAPAQLMIRGYGYTRYVSDGSQQITIDATNAASGQRLSFPTERMPMVEAALWAADLVYSHDNDGFRCIVDVAALKAVSVTSEAPNAASNEWCFSCRIDDGDISRTTELTKVWKLGSGAVIGASVLADETVATVKTETDKPLRIGFETRGVVAASFEVTGSRASVRLTAKTNANRILFHTPGTATVEANRSPDGTFVADLPASQSPPTIWRARAVTPAGDVRPLIAPAGFVPGFAPNASGVRASVTRTGQAVVEVRPHTAIVEEIGCDSAAVIELNGFLLALDEFEIGVAPEDGYPRVWYPATVTDGRFVARIPTATSTGTSEGRPLPAGKYAVFARRATPDGPAEAELLLSDRAAGTLPLNRLAAVVKVKVLRSRGGIVGLEIAAPVPDEALGRFSQARLAAKYGVSPRNLDDAAVFFLVDIGNNAADSALAIHNELRRRGSRLKLYWGVEDLSVPVPDGGIPVVKRTEEWFAKVNSCRYLVNNYGGMWGLTKDSGQRYLQTWHGTPLKFIGASEARHRGALKPRFDQIAAEAAEWDAFVSPSPYFSALIPSEFLYHGAVLETGYPRNDRLATASAADQQAIRARFDIPAAAKVALYAPTFRDNERRGWRAPLFDGLDLGRLLDLLGRDWVLLLRGHIFNANDDHADRTAGRLIDVTRHGDINDLYLASDVLITDYSSVMFDYAVTGKPMVFFTPDLDAYVAGRGTYFDLREEAPGPLYTKVGDLAAGLADLHGLANLHRDRYDAFRTKFAPWDDGKAAARVIDAFFD